MTRSIKRLGIGVGLMALLGATLPATAAAADGSKIDSGDTAWMLASTALVMIMLPGLALFYGGLVRRKNVLSTIMHSFFGLALVSVVWVIVGFSLAFGPDVERLGHHRRPRLRRLHERRHGAEHGLRGDDPIPPVRRLPAHVRGDHARPHHRRVRRAQAVRRLRPVHRPLVDPRLLADRPLGLVGRRLALQGSARSTSPAGPSSTSAPAYRPSSSRSSSASGS